MILYPYLALWNYSENEGWLYYKVIIYCVQHFVGSIDINPIYSIVGLDPYVCAITSNR